MAILRHLGVRRASERDRSALRAWLVEDCRLSCATVEAQVAAGYAWCLARSIHVASDKIMERLVRGARHDFVEGLVSSIARALPAHTSAKLEASLCEPTGPTGFHRLKDDVGAASLGSIKIRGVKQRGHVLNDLWSARRRGRDTSSGTSP